MLGTADHAHFKALQTNPSSNNNSKKAKDGENLQQNNKKTT